MKRQIKFRGWDQQAKEWNDKNYTVPGYENHQLPDMYDWQMLQEYSMDVLVESQFEIMQFTGLVDKNGTEIYEGDIVEFPELYETPEMTSTNYIKAMVVFEHGSFHIKTKGEEIGADTYNLAHEMQAYDGNFIVIGNIYETPDLLS